MAKGEEAKLKKQNILTNNFFQLILGDLASKRTQDTDPWLKFNVKK